MYPLKVGIAEGTLDIKEYDFPKDVFVGSNDKKYKFEDIKYFIIPKDEMAKIVGKPTKEDFSFNKNRKSMLDKEDSM